MKTWKKYLFIYIPIGVFSCLINFCADIKNMKYAAILE